MDLLRFAAEILPAYVQGSVITLQVTALALVTGLAIGTAAGLGQVYGGRVIRWLAVAYVSVIRALPPIAALFLFYFGLGKLVDLGAFGAGVLALAVLSGAFQAEIFRGAIFSVGESQMIAGRAIGMSRWQTIRHIILPQAARLAIPPWSNEASAMLKNSSLVYALGVTELLREAQFVSARTLQPFLAFGAAALIYLAFNALLTSALGQLQRRYPLSI